LENITKNVFVVGNTIVEPLNMFKDRVTHCEKRKDMILMDIHRPENFKYEERLKNALIFGNECIKRYRLPVKLLYFKRLDDAIKRWGIDLGNIEMIPLLPYQEYLETVYHSKFIISDSGTGQEEPALLNTQVVVPRDFTERPQSYVNNCSFKLTLNQDNTNFDQAFEWLDSNADNMDASWLGDGTASRKIVDGVKRFLHK